MRWASPVGRQLTELAIITTAREHDQPYEWSLHEMEAVAVGLDPAVINIVRHRGRINGKDDKEAIIQGFIVEDDVEGLSEVVKTATEPRVKSEAIHALGAVGGQQSKALLLQMYGNEKDPQIKRALIEGLFIQDDAHDLIQLARKESDPEMRKHLVQQLSVMDDREAKDYMLEILNK